MPHGLLEVVWRHVLPFLSTYVFFVFMSEAASVSSLLVVLAAMSVRPQYRMRWLKLASPLFIAGIVVYDMWNQPSQTMQDLSVFMSVAIFSFSMLITLKVAYILGLEKARSLPKASHAREKFDAEGLMKTLDKAVGLLATLTGGAAFCAASRPAAYAPPVGVVGLLIVLFTMFWRFGRQTSKTAVLVKFGQDLRCLLILSLTLSGLVSLILFWWIFGQLAVNLEVALVLFSAFCACLVAGLLGFLHIPTQLGGASGDPRRIAFLNSYWGFEKLIAFLLLVLIFLFSDVPLILLLNLTGRTPYTVIWAAGVVGLLAALVRLHSLQKTSLMIESNQVSRALVDATIVRLASSYLA